MVKAFISNLILRIKKFFKPKNMSFQNINLEVVETLRTIGYHISPIDTLLVNTNINTNSKEITFLILVNHQITPSIKLKLQYDITLNTYEYLFSFNFNDKLVNTLQKYVEACVVIKSYLEMKRNSIINNFQNA